MEIEFTYNTLSSLIAAAEKSGLPVSRLVLMQQAEQMEQSEDEIYRHMEETYRVMASCIEPGCAPDLRSLQDEPGLKVRQEPDRFPALRRAVPGAGGL